MSIFLKSLSKGYIIHIILDKGVCIMRYFICCERNRKLNILGVYNSEEEALKKLKYFVKKEKVALKVVPIPEIGVGCKIYRSDGTYYGTIVYETNTLWGVSEGQKGGAISNPYVKQRMEQLIIGKNLIVVDGKEFAEINNVIDMLVKLSMKVSELLKNLEYINAEQIAFFK